MEEIRISDILQRGSALKTQVQNSIDWIPNVVLDMYLDTNEMALIYDDRYTGNLVLVGDAIKLNYVDGDVQYMIETWITSIRIEPVRLMTVKIVSIKKMNNLRKAERYSVNYGAKITCFENPDGVFGVITNISIYGLGFVARQTFMVGEVINISIMLPSSCFIIDGEIVRTGENIKGTEYGVSFIRNDEEAIEELNKLIEDIKEREDRLSHIVGFNMR